MEEIMVSICCATYNHEKYLRKALDGIFMQKVNFAYEVIIGEDHSTDNSAKIIQEYEKKFASVIKAYYREKNWGPGKNFRDIFSKARGKYVIVLETDDYWIDENKLQKQVDILENNDEVIAVAHNTIIVGKNGEKLSVDYPECKNSKYTFEDFENSILPGQNTTIMYRNIYKDKQINTSFLFEKSKGPGDRKKIFVLLSYGEIWCIQEKMSAYRYVNSEGSSYSATYRPTALDWCNYYQSFIKYAYEIKNEDGEKCAESIFFINSVAALFKHEYSKKQFYLQWKRLHFKKHCLYKLIKFVVENKVRKKQNHTI